MKGLSLASLLVVLGGCFLPSFEKVDDSSGGGGSAGAGGATCDLAKPPEAPTNPPPGGEVDFYVAMRTVDVGETHLPTRPGYDLDGVCRCCETCDQPTCAPPTGATELEFCDAIEGTPNGGRDNNAAKYIARLDGVRDEVTSQPMSQRADQGLWSVIVRVSQYNGEPNDGAVSLSVYATTGSTTMPAWTGSDVWRIRRDSLDPANATLDGALVRRDDAYVVDGKLVAHFDPTPLTIVLPLNFVVMLEEGIFEATITKDANDDYQLEGGVIAGRWRITDALSALGGMKTPVGAVVCTDTPEYQPLYKAPLCSLLDESTVGGPGPCDALSFGIGFTANQIASTPQIVDFDTTRPCLDTVDPMFDTCN